MKFKIGDIVKRINSSNENMNIGDTGVIKRISDSNRINVQIIGFNAWHSMDNIVLVKNTENILKDYEIY